jgi:transcriptional regulator with XRE-family HTH domain
MGVSPVVRRRRLAAELRRLRAAAGKTIEEAAQHLECSTAKIRRIETGQVGTRIQDVRDLLDCYGVAGLERQTLLEVSRQARGRGWWHIYSDMVSEEFLTYLGLEDEAGLVCTYETYFVPGLLQTERYARAVMTAKPDTPLSTVERGLELRRTRWQLLDRAEPPAVEAVLDEGVLRRLTGGGELMAEQCEHLLALAARPSVALRIVPLGAGAYPDGGCSFTLLGFNDPADPKIAYAEVTASEHYTEDAAHIARYQSAFDHLRAQALGPDGSAALSRTRAEELRAGRLAGI